MPRHKNQVVSIQTLQPSIFRAPHTKTKPNMIQTRKSSGVHPPHRYRVNFDLPRKNLVKFNPLRKNHVTFDQLVWNQLSTLNSSPFWFLDPKTQVNFVPDTKAVAERFVKIPWSDESEWWNLLPGDPSLEWGFAPHCRQWISTVAKFNREYA